MVLAHPDHVLSPRYACRLDDKQIGNTNVSMKRVIEAITFNSELADESIWLLLTSEQMGFPLRQTGGKSTRKGQRFEIAAKEYVTT